jgi:hypothetical protein
MPGDDVRVGDFGEEAVIEGYEGSVDVKAL